MSASPAPGRAAEEAAAALVTICNASTAPAEVAFILPGERYAMKNHAAYGWFGLRPGACADPFPAPEGAAILLAVRGPEGRPMRLEGASEPPGRHFICGGLPGQTTPSLGPDRRPRPAAPPTPPEILSMATFRGFPIRSCRDDAPEPTRFEVTRRVVQAADHYTIE